jgi:PAS domain S-box-containing protein/putative nucleotidyltransferase with HDIG domain
MDSYFDNDVVGIVETNANFQIVRVNPRVCKMLEYTSEELLQRTWMDITDPEDIQKSRDHFDPILESGVSSTALEVRYRTKSGHVLCGALNVQVGERDAAGVPKKYIGFIMDITRQKQAESEVLNANRRMSDLHNKISRALGDTLGSRDPYTADHQNHVARLAGRMADILDLPLLERRTVITAASLHDIGKAGIPNEYLTKPTNLDDMEMAIVRSHALRGFEILRPMDTEFPIAEIVCQHHERLDGSGYPRGLLNGSMLREAQIIAAADTADAIVNARPFRRALGKDYAIAELTGERGTKLLEDVADACIIALNEMPEYSSTGVPAR